MHDALVDSAGLGRFHDLPHHLLPVHEHGEAVDGGFGGNLEEIDPFQLPVQPVGEDLFHRGDRSAVLDGDGDPVRGNLDGVPVSP
jgi:hypothetical protein